MYNLNEQHALGFTLLVNMDTEEDMGIGLKPRCRYWLNRSFSLDVAPGVLLSRSNSKAPDFTGNLGINYKDWIALIAQVDEVDKIYEDPYTNFSCGVKIGNKAGAGIIGISAIAFGIAIIGLSSLGE